MKRLLMLMLLSLGLAAFAAHAQEGPDALIKRVASDVLATLKADKDIQSGNKKKLYELVDGKIAGNFDFHRMTALAMGRNWSKATPEQQKALAVEFKTLLIRTYSGALSNYQNHAMDFKPLRMQPADTDVTVRTTVTAPGGQPIGIDYSMEKKGEGWKAYDVIVGGVSLVTNYREEFNNAIRDSGVDGLLKTLATKNKS
ncbi:MAG: ABC transporter substrate-binding protein [Burkholderiales bacterium]|nr:ABC transporter substrate-binding protein [Burkholderiales bacterium]